MTGPDRALSFGAVAEEYDRYRPGPPMAAVEWLLPPRADTAVDIGAGTGALTRLLVRKVRHVVAVEPDARMGAVLAARVPEATVVSGRAENLPLSDRSADAVMGSSMWHWVDEARAGGEAARVLRPGGVLGLLWSGPDRSQGWVAELLRRPDWQPPRPRHHEVQLPSDVPFTAPEVHTLEWSMTMTPEQLVGLAGTYSAVIALPELQRAELRDRLAILAGREAIELPMRCTCWRAVRR